MPYPVPARQPAPKPAPSQPFVRRGERLAVAVVLLVWVAVFVAILTH